MPTYNVEKYIQPCLDSICAQTYPNLEIICVDDCSQDGTAQVLLNAATKDSRIKVTVMEKNSGVAVARNEGLAQAQGEFIAFCDADDLMKPQMLEKLYNALAEQNSDVSLCLYEFIKNNNNILEKSPSFFSELLELSKDDRGAQFCSKAIANKDMQPYLFNILPAPWGKMFRANAISIKTKKKLKDITFNPSIRSGQDQPWTIELILSANSVSLVDENLYLYRILNNSLSHQKTSVRLDNLKMLVEIKKLLENFNVYTKIKEQFEIKALNDYFGNLENIPKKYIDSYRQQTIMQLPLLELDKNIDSRTKQLLTHIRYKITSDKKKKRALRLHFAMMKKKYKLMKFINKKK